MFIVIFFFCEVFKQLNSRGDVILVYLQIEYTLVELDHAAKKPRLSLVGPKILETLQQPETDDPDNHHTKWRPEYASYMIEGWPA